MPRKSKPIEYLGVEEVISLHASVIRDAEDAVSPAILSEDLIVSAVNRPIHAAIYDEADLYRQAATLLWGIAKAHGFLDGNKRVAWVATRNFLALNGFTIASLADEASALLVGIAENEITVDATEVWMRAHMKPRS